MKNLEKLLKCTDINYIVGDTNKEITDITADSREVKEGSLFICLDGAHVDGHNYAASAAQKGAAAIVASREIDVPEGTTVVYVTDTRKAMEDITPFYFDYPARRMRMIAVTGPNWGPQCVEGSGDWMARSMVQGGGYWNHPLAD